jgi:hypothetical protein
MLRRVSREALLNPRPRLTPAVVRREEGSLLQEVLVVAEAKPADFVGTRRLEEAGGAAWCTWRNILQGYYRFTRRTSDTRASVTSTFVSSRARSRGAYLAKEALQRPPLCARRS